MKSVSTPRLRLLYLAKQITLDLVFLANPGFISAMPVDKMNLNQCTRMSRVTTCLQNSEGTSSVSGCNPVA